MIKLLTALLLVCITSFAFPQGLNVPKGKDFTYTARTIGNGTSTYDVLNTYAFHSLGKNAGGNNVFECRLIKAVTKDGRRVTPSVNTDDPHAAALNSSSVINVWAFLQQMFKVTIDSKGNVLDMEGLDGIVNQASAKWHLQAGIKRQLISWTNKVQYDIQKMFFQIPEDITGTPGEWKAKNGTVYKISPAIAPQLSLNLNKELNDPKKKVSEAGPFTKISFDGTKATNEKGFYIIDDKTGLIVNSAINRDFDLDYSSVKNHVADDYTLEAGNDATVAQPDTAWMNMAVNMGYYSDAFKTEGKYDLAKMQSFFKANDTKFASDAYYQTRKLDALQQLDQSKENRKLYDSTLLATPNEALYLENDHHTQLVNKFYKLSETDGQKAYDVAKMFYKTAAFQDWIQETSAQNFLNSGDTALVERQSVMKLLNLMMADKDTIMRKVATPLYLWASVRETPGDIALLTKNAAQLAAADNQTMQLGKGGRYGLLLYKILLNAGKKADAEKLLSATISKLNTIVADTLYRNRATDRYTLACIYYLKYQAEKAAANPNALQNLSLAAQFSPSGPSDKTYMLGYDQFFFHSKDNYRQEFIETLFNSGNEQQALKTFAAHISAVPESLQQMKALYQSKFPGKDFKTVFEKEIIGSWANAPDFTLKDLDNNDHHLKEYLNKWMVIDFWGTWCGPCVAELPKINTFNKELAENKNAGFLSIACQDFTQTVIPFMEKNAYSFRVLMSDNFIQKKYKVPAYPHKVLVSPTGKMIPLEYGKDWQSILKTFSSI